MRMAPTRRTPLRQSSDRRSDSNAKQASSQARLSAERRATSAARRATLTEARSCSVLTSPAPARSPPPIVLGPSTTSRTVPADLILERFIPSNISPSSAGNSLLRVVPSSVAPAVPETAFARNNRTALNERSLLSAFDYVSYPVPETRPNEVAQSRQIAREVRETGIASDGPRASDLQNLAPRHVRVSPGVARSIRGTQPSPSSLARSIRRSPLAGHTQQQTVPMGPSICCSQGSIPRSPIARSSYNYYSPRPRPRFVVNRDGSRVPEGSLGPLRDSTTPIGSVGRVAVAQASQALTAALGIVQTQPQRLPWGTNPTANNLNAAETNPFYEGLFGDQLDQQMPQGQGDSQDLATQRDGEILIWASPTGAGTQGSVSTPSSAGQENQHQEHDGLDQPRIPLGELPIPLDLDQAIQSIEDRDLAASLSNGPSQPTWGRCHLCPDFPSQVHHVCGRGCPGEFLGNPGSPPADVLSQSCSDPGPQITQPQTTDGTPLGNQEAERTRLREQQAAGNTVANGTKGVGQTASGNGQSSLPLTMVPDVVRRAMSDPFSADQNPQPNKAFPSLFETPNPALVPTPTAVRSVYGTPTQATPTPNPLLPLPTFADYNMMNVAELGAEAVRRGFVRENLNQRKAGLIAVLLTADANNNRGHGAYGYRAFEISRGRPDPGPRALRPASIENFGPPTDGGPAQRTRSHAA